MHLEINKLAKTGFLINKDKIIATFDYDTYSIVNEEKSADILDIAFYCKDLSTTLTIRDYLKKLLITLFEEQDEFSGKRPFGNSSWVHDLYYVLFKNGFIDGREELDNDGNILAVDYDSKKGFELLIDAIGRLE